MLQVRINGQQSPMNGATLPRMTDMIELIKSSIDPEHMIISLQINGSDMAESDWQASPVNFKETDILEVETGTPDFFVKERLRIIPGIIENIYILFRSSRQAFQTGDMEDGNKVLVTAVNDLKAFFEWYTSLLNLIPENERNGYGVDDKIEDITSVCKEICQQQLYQSWWALGTSLEEKLEPQLDKLETYFRKLATEA